MPQYGTFITKPGKDVTKLQNPNDYILNSNFNTFKIYKRIGGSITNPGAGASTQIVHGMGYHAGFLAYYRLKQASSTWWLDHTSMNSADDPDNGGYRSNGTQINKSVINFTARDGESAGDTTIEFAAFLLVDPISLVDPTTPGITLVEDYGFKVSKPGIDVTTAKPHQLLISSRYDSLKFHMERTVSFTVNNPATTGSASFQHGLGYVPMFMGVIQDYNDATKQRLVPFGRIPQAIATSIKADRSTITARTITDGTSSGSYTFRIIVFKNKLSDA